MAGLSNGDPHRKACLLIRQSLSPDSAYVDVAVHGSGLTSLQWREQAGGLTREVQSEVSALARVGLERQGEVFFMTLAPKAEASRIPGPTPGSNRRPGCTWGWPCALTMTRPWKWPGFPGSSWSGSRPPRPASRSCTAHWRRYRFARETAARSIIRPSTSKLPTGPGTASS